MIGALYTVGQRDLKRLLGYSSIGHAGYLLMGAAAGGSLGASAINFYLLGYLFTNLAAFLGIITQFFINLEIERWTLLTGESTVTGFCLLSRHWSYIFLIFLIVPYVFPGWSTGAAQIGSWLVFGPQTVEINGQISHHAYYVREIAMAGLVACGLILTAGPVVYNTVEKLETWLVGMNASCEPILRLSPPVCVTWSWQ